MIKTIYYIEDDCTIGHSVELYLDKYDYEILLFDTIEKAKLQMEQKRPSLLLMDWNLPDGSGVEYVKWVRERWPDLPIIVVTIRNDTQDVVKGFTAGADDYITKPFDLEVLLSRIRALLRRSSDLQEGYMSCGPIDLDRDKVRVYVHGHEKSLSMAEYELLLMLMEHKNQTVLRSTLLECIWDANGNFVNDNSLTVTMKRLREKLGNPTCIKTVRSFGYRMEENS